MFKKFNEFVDEGSDKKSEPSLFISKCDRCNKEEANCKCHEEDYYDANLDHYTPNGKTKKGNYHG